jgi:hypothetical protein
MNLFHRRRGKNPSEKKTDVQARDVRVKGATRPSHQRGEGLTAQTLQHARVERALQALLSAPDWETTHTVLATEYETLLTQDAIGTLRVFIEQARQQATGENRRMIAYLDAHLTLLEHARTMGVEDAWREFRTTRLGESDTDNNEITLPDDAETQATVDVLKQLLGTEHWSETYALLVEERQRLTSDTADQFLTALIQMAHQDPSPQAQEGVHYLELHRTLLRETRELGVDVAWANFDRQRRQLEAEVSAQISLPAVPDADLALVARALKALLNTANWSETRQILEREQHLLLTDACDQLLSELLNAAQRDSDPRATSGAVYLGLHRRLLRRARAEGIDHAWDEFEAALAEAASDMVKTPNQLQRIPPPNASEPTPHDVATAVEAFLSAASWEFALDILYARQNALLSEAAVDAVLARAEHIRQRGTGRDIYAAAQLEVQARLLLRAREVGIERAWQEFEQERGQG